MSRQAVYRKNFCFDRYILTEDERLKQFLEYTISRYCSPTFYSYQIIHAGGQGQAKGLMKRNIQYRFLGPEENVICILDGDQAQQTQPAQVHCIPLEDVENALWHEYRDPTFEHKFEGGEHLAAKDLYRRLTNTNKLLSHDWSSIIMSKAVNEPNQTKQDLVHIRSLSK